MPDLTVVMNDWVHCSFPQSHDIYPFLQELANLRADNQRLRDENGALIRVISKLSRK